MAYFNTVDFGKFQICPETVQYISDILRERVLVEAPGFYEFHNVFEGVVTDSTIGFSGDPGLVGVKRQDCHPKPQKFHVPFRKQAWSPKPWEVLLAECFAHFENDIAVFALKLGKDVKDLTQTEIAAFIVDHVMEALRKFFWRLYWFNDTEAAYFDEGGNISRSYIDQTSGEVIPLDLQYFNIIDGLWKHLEILSAERPAQHISISANAGATYADQRLEPEEAHQVLEDLWFSGGTEILSLRGADDKMLMVTQSVFDAYEQYLRTAGGCCIPIVYDNLVDGVQAIRWNGIPLIAMPIWDEMIYMFQNDGTKLYNPHRALLARKSALGVATDDLGAFSEIDIWYNRDTRETKFETMGKSDAQILNPRGFRLAM